MSISLLSDLVVEAVLDEVPVEGVRLLGLERRLEAPPAVIQQLVT
jgi:hypothetical protein